MISISCKLSSRWSNLLIAEGFDTVKIYKVTLASEERAMLKELVSVGKGRRP